MEESPDLIVFAALEGRHTRLGDLRGLHLRLLVEGDVAVGLNLSVSAVEPDSAADSGCAAVMSNLGFRV